MNVVCIGCSAKGITHNAPKIGDGKVYTITSNDKDRNFYSDQF